MKIKNLFDDLAAIGKKRYLSRNAEEELYFVGKNFVIEIVSYGGLIDLIINLNGNRKHYLDSACLSDDEKKQLESTLSAVTSEVIKGKTISKILLTAFSEKG